MFSLRGKKDNLLFLSNLTRLASACQREELQGNRGDRSVSPQTRREMFWSPANMLKYFINWTSAGEAEQNKCGTQQFDQPVDGDVFSAKSEVQERALKRT